MGKKTTTTTTAVSYWLNTDFSEDFNEDCDENSVKIDIIAVAISC